jgi:hypothetical protein
MGTTIDDATGPIEIWLSQANMAITGRVVFEDESTGELVVDSLSLRGAEREVTGYLIGNGWEPAGRWQDARDLDQGKPLDKSKGEAWLEGPNEVMRQFRRPRA